VVTHYTHTYRFGAFLTRSRIMACSFSRLHLSGRWRCYCVQRQASASRSCITIIKLFNPKSMTTQAINITHASSWENACFHTFTLVICGNLQVKNLPLEKIDEGSTASWKWSGFAIFGVSVISVTGGSLHQQYVF